MPLGRGGAEEAVWQILRFGCRLRHAESAKGIRLFASEVLPRLREIKSVTAE